LIATDLSIAIGDGRAYQLTGTYKKIEFTSQQTTVDDFLTENGLFLTIII
jgi:hypothetical protein